MVARLGHQMFDGRLIVGPSKAVHHPAHDVVMPFRQTMAQLLISRQIEQARSGSTGQILRTAGSQTTQLNNSKAVVARMTRARMGLVCDSLVHDRYLYDGVAPDDMRYALAMEALRHSTSLTIMV